MLNSIMGNDMRTLLNWTEGAVLPPFTPEQLQQRPLVRRRRWSSLGVQPDAQLPCPNTDTAGEGEDSGPFELIPCPRVRQYPSSLVQLREMAEGKRVSFQGPWRYGNQHSTTIAHQITSLPALPPPRPVSLTLLSSSSAPLALPSIRCVWQDGHCYENSHMTWVAQLETVREADGRVWQRPRRFMASIPADHIRRVDV